MYITTYLGTIIKHSVEFLDGPSCSCTYYTYLLIFFQLHAGSVTREFQALGISIKLHIEVKGSVPRHRARFQLQVLDVDKCTVQAETLFFMGFCFNPTDVGQPREYIFNWFCPKTAIANKGLQTYGPMYNGQQYDV